jgi:thymidine kinase
MTGSLELFVGPMYSGKSTALIEKADQYELCNKRVLMVNHTSDIRYGPSGIRTHGNHVKDAIMLSYLMDLIEEYQEMFEEHDVICVDEMQFFEDLKDFVLLALKRGKKIVMSGLMSKYTMEPFEHVALILSYADQITFLRSLCMTCKDGTKGSFTLKTNKDAPDVGSYDTYRPVCRSCYETFTFG